MCRQGRSRSAGRSALLAASGARRTSARGASRPVFSLLHEALNVCIAKGSTSFPRLSTFFLAVLQTGSFLFVRAQLPCFFNFIFLIVLFPVSSPTCSRALAVTLQRSSRCTFFSARISTFIVSVPQSRFPLSDRQDRLCFDPLIPCVRAALKSPLLAATSRSLSAACASPGHG